MLQCVLVLRFFFLLFLINCFRIVVDLLKKKGKDRTEFPYTPQPVSPVINIFHSYGAFITVNEPTLLGPS